MERVIDQQDLVIRALASKRTRTIPLHPKAKLGPEKHENCVSNKN